MEQKKTYLFGMIISAVLTAGGLVCDAFMLFQYFSVSLMNIVWIVETLVALFTVYYTFFGYKKPHGNLLKFLILLFAFSMMPKALYAALNDCIALSVLNMLIMIFISYVAGRLNRIDQNKYMFPFIFILLLAARLALVFAYPYTDSFDVIQCVACSTQNIIWLDICVAYFLRYKQHREAGLEDTPKIK